jgi:DNA-binding CsgD family transcriptional regulator
MSVISSTKCAGSGSSSRGDVVAGGGVLVANLDKATVTPFVSSGGVQGVIPAVFSRPATVSNENRPGVPRSGRASAVRPGLQKQEPRRRAAPSSSATSGALSAPDQQLQVLFYALSVIGIAIALLDGSSDVVAANLQFTELLPCVACTVLGRQRLADRVANRLIAEAMVQAGHSVQDAGPLAIPLRRDDGRLMAIGHLVPIDRVEAGPMKGVRAILIANRAGPREALDPSLLQRLFGLSPAEARVACGIVEGQTLNTMADTFGVSRETVRSQLKRVLAKSGVERQVELAVLLGGLQL